MNYLIWIAAILVILYALRSFFFSSGKFESISAAEAKKLLSSRQAMALDVRTSGELSGGQIKGAKHINVMDRNFVKGLGDLDKSQPYVVYCKSGMRSARACRIMAAEGFEKLYNLKGGFGTW